MCPEFLISVLNEKNVLFRHKEIQICWRKICGNQLNPIHIFRLLLIVSPVCAYVS
jgi:hypothetical protein